MKASCLALALAPLTGGQPQVSPRPGPGPVHLVLQQELQRGEAPVPGVNVEVGWQADWSFVGPPGSRTPLRTLTLDENGRAEAELEFPAEADRSAVLCAQVVSAGFQQWTRMTSVERKEETQYLALPARRGGTLYGVVRAEPSAERGRAHLRLVRTGVTEANTEMLGATADEDGRFRLHFRERGRYALQASWKGRGIAVQRDLALDPLGDPGHVTLELGAGLRLAGRVLDPDGAPVFPFTVSVLPAGFSLARDKPRGWNDDLFAERVVTDAEGRFELRGLAPGSYVPVGAFEGRLPEVLSTELVPAGATAVMLEARVHRLVLRVLDHEARPLDLQTLCGQPGPRQISEAMLHCGIHANARLRLALELPRQGDEDSLRTALEGEGDFRFALREILGGATVELVPALEGAPVRPEFSVALEGAEPRNIVVPWIAPGRDCISVSGLAPGAYRLVVELPDGQELVQALELVEHGTTSVSLRP